jgi:hypothetical protein
MKDIKLEEEIKKEYFNLSVSQTGMLEYYLRLNYFKRCREYFSLALEEISK